MQTLAIDIETFSSIDLRSSGVFSYTESDDFEILLFGYAFGDAPVMVIDLAQGEAMPTDVIEALADPSIIKTAFNAQFERTCLAKYFKIEMPPDQWRCSMAHSLTLGLPGNLAGVAQALILEVQKMSEGRALIRYFSIPCKATKTNNGRTRNLPEHDRDKWHTFKKYCQQDVEVERSIRKKLDKFPMTDDELALWFLDQKMNDHGVRIDKTLVENAIKCAEIYQEKLYEEAVELTGLDNPNSPMQLKRWLEAETGLEVNSLTKDTVSELLQKEISSKAKRVLELRQDMSKTSIKKYEAMDRAICKDERIRGLLQFYGAATGRWAGRLVQVQNLPRNTMSDLNMARDFLKSGNFEALELLFDSVPDVLSQLIRTAFIPSEGSRFIVSDFSAIEARVIATVANEKWRMDVFNSHGKIYEASAAEMFNVPIAEVTKGSELRQRGKVGELALGFQGGVGALMAMGALDMGLEEEELKPLVDAWRQSNPNIVRLWWDVGAAAIKAVKERTTVEIQYGLKFTYKSGILFITLPSGRSLAYVRPRVERDERFNRDKLTFEGIMPGTQGSKRVDTYAGRISENITQSIARDCLAISMMRLDAAGYKIAFHVHDEVVLEVPNGKGSLEEVEAIMGLPIDWAPGLPLKAEGFVSDYYKKD